jgi:hypothetical protein
MKKKRKTVEELEEASRQWEAEERQRYDDMFAANTEWLAADQNHGYVYIAEAGDHIKIGWARDVRYRIATLQTGNPYPIELKGAIPDDNAYLLEQILHGFFRAYNHNGEWHRSLSYDETEEAIKQFEKWSSEIAEQLREALHN